MTGREERPAVGATLLHYRIERRLGQGGMGEVFLAEDTRLGRKVALKFLPPEMADDPMRLERLEREARTIAALNHPSIVTLHAVERAGDTPFLAMEWIDGSTLEEAIPSAGLPLDRLLDLALPIADALAAAHARGITHRDLKPANVMITRDDRVKVLDFGLAKLSATEPAGENDPTQVLTREGTLVGTVRYMSPEQARGDAVDPRSDVFALGVLLYEMAAGRPTFSGETAAELLTAILRSEPPPIGTLRPDLPNHFGRIVRRCLEKDPQRRYQSALEIRNELAGLQREAQSRPAQTVPGAEPEPRPSRKLPPPVLWATLALGALILVGLVWVARRGGPAGSGGDPVATTPAVSELEAPRAVVLPLDNLGRDEDAYFAAGLTEELNSRLATAQGLRMISSRSAARYATLDRPPEEVGAELGADYVLLGSVRWSPADEGPSRLRITPQLVEVASAETVWSESYDGRLEDIFELQEAIADRVVTAVGAALRGTTSAQPDRPTESLAAYQAYLRGRYLRATNYYDPEATAAAESAFERALELDPGFARAWAQLAMLHSSLLRIGVDVSEARRRAAGRAIARAEALDPDDGEVLQAQAIYHYHALDEPGRALPFVDRAIERAGRTAELLALRAYVLRRLGRSAQSEQFLAEAIELDPSNALMRVELGISHARSGRHKQAIATFEGAIEVDPTRPVAYSLLAYALWLDDGNLLRAREILEAAPPADDSYTIATWYRQLLFENRLDEAIELLETSNLQWFGVAAARRPLSLFVAEAHEAADRPAAARAAYLEAESTLRRELESAPADGRLLGALAAVEAGLGRSEQALERVGLAIDQSQNPAVKAQLRIERARILTRLGRLDEAAAEVREVLEAKSALISPHFLRLDPGWRTLVESDAFREIERRFG